MGKEKKAYSSNFKHRKMLLKRERNDFLSTGKKFSRFEDYMADPLDSYKREIEEKFIDVDGNEKTRKVFKEDTGKFRFVCNQPLQVRIFGNLKEASDLANKIRRMLGYKIITKIPTSIMGIDKVECDKKQRYGNYCSNAVRVYFNLEPRDQQSCEIERLK